MGPLSGSLSPFLIVNFSLFLSKGLDWCGDLIHTFYLTVFLLTTPFSPWILGLGSSNTLFSLALTSHLSHSHEQHYKIAISSSIFFKSNFLANSGYCGRRSLHVAFQLGLSFQLVRQAARVFLPVTGARNWSSRSPAGPSYAHYLQGYP